MTNNIIQLTVHPFKYPIAFEITGIKIIGTSQDIDNRCIVNNVEVAESYREVIFTLMEL